MCEATSGRSKAMLVLKIELWEPSAPSTRTSRTQSPL